MHTLKIEKKSIITTISETIYKNSDLSDVHIIIPRTIDGMEISETNVIMEYVLPIDKSSNYAILKLNDKNYRDRWLEYTIRPTDGIVISSQPGEVLFRLLINNKKIENGKINITPVAMEEATSDVTSEELISITPTSTATASLMSFDQTSLDQSSVITFDNYNDYNDYDYYIICDDGRYPVYREYMDDFDYSIIEGRDIRLTPYQLNISQEENSQYISFRMNRFEDGIDRLDKKIEIRYTNPDGDFDSATPVNLSYNNFYITFGWLISANVTFVSGNIKFWLQVDGVNEKNENYVWKTKVNSDMNVLPCLDGDGIIEPTDPDWYSNIVRVENAKLQEINDVIEQAALVLEESSGKVNDSITKSTIATTNAITAAEIANTSALTADNSANTANSAADRVNNVITEANDAITTANDSAEAANTAANSVEKAIDNANAGATIANSAAEEARNEAVNASTATRNAISATESANIAAGAATKAADSIQVAVDAAEQAQISQTAAEAVRDYMLKEKDSFTGYDRRYTNINFANAIIGTASGNGSVSVSDAWSAPVYNLAVDGKGVQETTTGAQLIDFSNYTVSPGVTADISADGYTITVIGKSAYSGIRFYLPDRYAGKTIVFDYDNMVTTSTVRIISMQYKDSGGTTVYIAGKGVPIAIPEGATNIFCYINVNNSATAFSEDASITVYGLRVNEGSTVLPWEPYTGGMSSPNPNYPQEVQSVGDGEVMEVVSSVGGRNLLLDTKSLVNQTDPLAGWAYVKASSSSTLFRSMEEGFAVWTMSESGLVNNAINSLYGNTVKLSDITDNLIFSVYIKVTNLDAWDVKAPLVYELYDKDLKRVGWSDVYISYAATNNPTIVNGKWVKFTYTKALTSLLTATYATDKSGDDVVYVRFRLTLFRNGEISFKQPKLELGTTATPWTPAPEDVTEKNQAEYLPCLFKTQVPAVLRGIDDVRDKLECREGVWGIWRYTISMRGLKWTEPRSPLGTAYENSFFAVADLWGMQINNYTNLLSSVFADVTSDRILDENVNGCYVYDGTIRARIVGVSTYDQFYQVINDAEFVIPLATPVWEPLPDYIQLQLNSLVMYRGDTSCVYVTGTDIVPDMTVNYVQDTNKVIQELRTAIIALGGAT